MLFSYRNSVYILKINILFYMLFSNVFSPAPFLLATFFFFFHLKCRIFFLLCSLTYLFFLLLPSFLLSYHEIIAKFRERETITVWYFLYVQSKYDTNELICKTETNLQTQRTNLWMLSRAEGRVINWEFCISICKLLYIEWIINKDLMYRTKNYIQDLVIS